MVSLNCSFPGWNDRSLMTLENENCVHYFRLAIIYTGSNIYIDPHRSVLKMSHTKLDLNQLSMAFGSNQQASGMILVAYLTTPFGRIPKFYLNLLVSWHGPNFEVFIVKRIFNRILGLLESTPEA